MFSKKILVISKYDKQFTDFLFFKQGFKKKLRIELLFLITSNYNVKCCSIKYVIVKDVQSIFTKSGNK